MVDSRDNQVLLSIGIAVDRDDILATDMICEKPLEQQSLLTCNLDDMRFFVSKHQLR
jgi:hypothetical protein